ncbi:hypothetical protein BFN03_17415 [Rhodococcus sp. WMMA185]|uniref:hypothetical protein n=1 Tax=Rhodococcus sp. WMMA185 TaxID=679318 RepID=UPI000878BB14|nr:hypothetical protein [Rhodococcus sp. WMMA185]AOW93833.1 hypothetical protein BFN03_17415 [Rhodococcus sp. WMMA185]
MMQSELRFASPPINPIPQILYWPQKLSYWWLLFSALTLAMSILCGFALSEAVREGASGEVGIFTVFLTLFICMTVMVPSTAGISWIGVSRRVGSRTTEHGTAVSIPDSRSVHTIVFLLGLIGISASIAAAMAFTGIGETLLPNGLETREGAYFMGAYGAGALLCILAILAFRAASTLLIYPSGIQYIIRGHQFFRATTDDRFFEWDDIACITPDTWMYTHGSVEFFNPLLKITTTSGADASTNSDPKETTIHAHRLVAEPNALRSLLEYMRTNPEARDLLAKQDAPKLLTPPPLIDRLRAGRKIDRPWPISVQKARQKAAEFQRLQRRRPTKPSGDAVRRRRSMPPPGSAPLPVTG